MDAITSSFAELDAGCSNLADMIDSCSMATPGFTDLGYASQAKCYWQVPPSLVSYAPLSPVTSKRI